MDRVRTDGKQFAIGDDRFRFRGVTYGTFRPRDSDGSRFPELDGIKKDFDLMRERGFTVVRTYTAPPEDLLDLAADWDLRVLVGAFFPDWRYLVGGSRRELARVTRDARREVTEVARRLAGNPTVLGLSLGNEVPADVLRGYGTGRIASAFEGLSEAVRRIDDQLLLTYANYPTAEYLSVDFADFVTFNVFLEDRHDFERYLTRLQNLAGARPLVLGELGLHVGDGEEAEERQAATIDWLMATSLERGVAGTCIFSWTDEWWVGDAAVEGWHFGLTRADRSPRPALEVAERWNERTVRDVLDVWPSISVVICAYNAAATLDECLEHTCRLDYPDLEIIVIDDGSTDDTIEIAFRHPRARVLTIPHAGLSVARNEGYRIASGEIVAYLDSDAFPTPEWPYFLALGMDAPTVGGVGGPNIPPPSDPPGAQQVALAPGGPVHVLLADNRAEHIPGCNMAFWRDLLVDVGGFDPVYTAAGDDVDFCWRVLDREWEIGFHPAALVWHHRRSGFRPYLRQQRGYGRSEALVEARHPDRFTSTGSARWRGRIYNSLTPSRFGQRIYRGMYGTAAFQSLYGGGGYALDLAHQVGVPVAAVAILLLPLALLSPTVMAPGALAIAYLAVLAGIDIRRARPPRWIRSRRVRFRLGVVAMQLAQPLVRTWSRSRQSGEARRAVGAGRAALPPAAQRVSGALIYPATAPRAEFAAAAVTTIRGLGLRVAPATGWEDHDGLVSGSVFVRAALVTSAYPEGCLQLRFRRRLRWVPLAIVAAVAAVVAVAAPLLALAVAAVAAVDLATGTARTGRRLLRRLAADPAGEA